MSPRGDDEGHKALTRDELLAWASSFGAATHAVIAMILDRNSAAIPRGLIQARNVLRVGGIPVFESVKARVFSNKLLPVEDAY